MSKINAFDAIMYKANKIEDLRVKLYTDKNHNEEFTPEEVQYIDNELFRIQSELRELAGYCKIF